MKNNQDLLELGFQLAYFIVPDRSTSLRVLTDAMNKLSAQRTREEKRLYWRDKHLKGKITRITRQQEDMLQWLIYLESDRYERQQEQTGGSRPADMLVHYIKYLVQMTTAMSSFYVSVGLFRLLHDYSTPETQQMYEGLTQHYPGPQEYRRVKGLLLNQLQTRFAGFLRTCKGDRGELRLQLAENQDCWARCVNDCLRMFTPWSTRRSCAQSAVGLELANAADFSRVGGDWDQDAVEIQRCHLFIEPVCRARITEVVGLAPPHKRLAVPMFVLDANHNGDDFWVGRNEAPELSDDERNAVRAELDKQAARRQRVVPAFLTVVAHEIEYGRLDADGSNRLRSRIPEGVRLIEVHAHDGNARVVIATHWVRYTEHDGIAAARGALLLGHRKKLHFEIRPDIDESGDHGAWLEFDLVTERGFAAWARSLGLSLQLRRLPELALAAVLLSVGWFLGSHHHESQLGDGRLGSGQERPLVQQGPGVTQPAMQPYRLIPDDFNVRSLTKTTNAVTISSGGVLALELVVPASSHIPYRGVLKRFSKDQEIMTESQLIASEKSGTDVVQFVLPASLLKKGEYYVVALYAHTASGQGQIYRSYTFYAKESASD